MGPIDDRFDEDAPVFDRTVRPHRSLHRRHGLLVAGALAAASMSIGVVLALVGAWPVLGFAGTEIALAVALLLLHGRAARGSERLLMTGRVMRVERTDVRGRMRALQLSTAWLQVALEERRGTVPLLLLRRRRQSVEIASALGAEQKREIGQALAAALARTRAPLLD